MVFIVTCERKNREDPASELWHNSFSSTKVHDDERGLPRVRFGTVQLGVTYFFSMGTDGRAIRPKLKTETPTIRCS